MSLYEPNPVEQPHLSRLRELLAAGKRSQASIYASIHANILAREQRLLDEAEAKANVPVIPPPTDFKALEHWELLRARGERTRAALYWQTHGAELIAQRDARAAQPALSPAQAAIEATREAQLDAVSGESTKEEQTQ